MMLIRWPHVCEYRYIRVLIHRVNWMTMSMYIFWEIQVFVRVVWISFVSVFDIISRLLLSISMLT